MNTQYKFLLFYVSSVSLLIFGKWLGVFISPWWLIASPMWVVVVLALLYCLISIAYWVWCFIMTLVGDVLK